MRGKIIATVVAAALLITVAVVFAVTGNVKLGPFTASVEKLGVKLALDGRRGDHDCLGSTVEPADVAPEPAGGQMRALGNIIGELRVIGGGEGQAALQAPGARGAAQRSSRWASVTTCPHGPLLVRGDVEILDARRGMLKRVGWRTEADGSHIDGLLLTDAQRDPNSESLLDTALAGRVWSGSRLAVFAHSGSGGARDAVVCNCMGIRESQIRTQVALGAGVVELKERLGCGTVCGSCLPQLVQLCRQPQRA